MKIMIVSDTHRHNENLEKALLVEKPIDLFIHLGDIESSEDYIQSIAECPCLLVAGNNDYFSMLNKEIITNIGKYKVLLTHGHHYYVSVGNEIIRTEAEAQNIDIAMFGHTHRPLIEKKGKVTLINPGSLSYPRQDGKIPTYIIMTINKKGDAEFEIKYAS